MDKLVRHGSNFQGVAWGGTSAVLGGASAPRPSLRTSQRAPLLCLCGVRLTVAPLQGSPSPRGGRAATAPNFLPRRHLRPGPSPPERAGAGRPRSSRPSVSHTSFRGRGPLSSGGARPSPFPEGEPPCSTPPRLLWGAPGTPTARRRTASARAPSPQAGLPPRPLPRRGVPSSRLRRAGLLRALRTRPRAAPGVAAGSGRGAVRDASGSLRLPPRLPRPPPPPPLCARPSCERQDGGAQAAACPAVGDHGAGAHPGPGGPARAHGALQRAAQPVTGRAGGLPRAGRAPPARDPAGCEVGGPPARSGAAEGWTGTGSPPCPDPGTPRPACKPAGAAGAAPLPDGAEGCLTRTRWV